MARRAMASTISAGTGCTVGKEAGREHSSPGGQGIATAEARLSGKDGDERKIYATLAARLGKAGVTLEAQAAIIRVFMAMKRKWQPGIFNHQEIHPEINFDNTHFSPFD